MRNEENVQLTHHTLLEGLAAISSFAAFPGASQPISIPSSETALKTKDCAAKCAGAPLIDGPVYLGFRSQPHPESLVFTSSEN